MTDRGLAIASPDGANVLKVRGTVQLDSRLFFNDGGGVANNSFVLRRARLITEGQFARNYSYQILTEFSGGSVSVYDANLTVALTPALQFKFGKFKVPIGLELLQSDSSTFFNERSLVTNLVPNRDLGIQAQGDLLDGRVSYQAGVFGGVPDGAITTNTDFDNEKDGVLRITAAPFKSDIGSPLQGLSFGLAGSSGREKTVAGRTAGYRTDGQQTFFSYNSSTIADGRTWRLSPQFDYRNGSLGIMGEYVVSTVNIRPNAVGPKSAARHRAWQLALGYVLTGEDSSYNGVVPHDNFDWSAGTWGALEVVARYAQLELDDRVFPTLAAVSGNADAANAAGVGLNWYLAKAVTFKFDAFKTKFGFSPATNLALLPQILRHDENAFISRFQISF